MDKIIKLYDAVQYDDLMICERKGVAYQRIMPTCHNKGYDNYFKHCDDKYSDKNIELAINICRMALTDKHIGNCKLLDIGIGNGSFIRHRNSVSGGVTWGYDVDKQANNGLKKTN